MLTLLLLHMHALSVCVLVQCHVVAQRHRYASLLCCLACVALLSSTALPSLCMHLLTAVWQSRLLMGIQSRLLNAKGWNASSSWDRSGRVTALAAGSLPCGRAGCLVLGARLSTCIARICCMLIAMWQSELLVVSQAHRAGCSWACGATCSSSRFGSSRCSRRVRPRNVKTEALIVRRPSSQWCFVVSL